MAKKTVAGSLKTQQVVSTEELRSLKVAELLFLLIEQGWVVGKKGDKFEATLGWTAPGNAHIGFRADTLEELTMLMVDYH